MFRPYQKDAMQAVKERLEAGVTRQLISMPTGTGKTVVFAGLPEFLNVGKRVLVLVHREELADQAARKFHSWNPKYSIGIEMASQYSEPANNVVVASVQTIGRKGSKRIESLNPADFGLVIVDEAHHAVADTYKRVFEYFNLMAPDSKTLLLGVTATPKRGDGQALGQVFDEIVYHMPIETAIEQGWLVDLKGFRVNTTVDLSKVKTVAGDFALRELEEAVNTPYRNELIVRHWMRRAGDRQTIAFTVDIAHAQDLAQMYRKLGFKAEAIWGDDPDRKAKLKAHKSGEIQVLTNCGVLTEGYDDPGIRCVVMARPTKSSLLYVQMAGRGTRLPEGCNNLQEALAQAIKLPKTDCILLDAVDNSGRHSLVTLGTVFGLPPKADLNGKSVVIAKQEVEEAIVAGKLPVDKIDRIVDLSKLDEFCEEVNLFTVKLAPEVEENSNLAWKNMPDGSFILLLPGGESCKIQQNLLQQWEVFVHVNGMRMENKFPTLPEAFRWGDDKVTLLGKEHLRLLRRDAKWVGDPASPSQMGLLRKFYGSRVPTNLTKGEASALIQDFITRKRRRL